MRAYIVLSDENQMVEVRAVFDTQRKAERYIEEENEDLGVENEHESPFWIEDYLIR